MEEKELKVSKTTEPKKLAGTIKHYINKGIPCRLLSLGSQSICISVKAIALLSSMFSLNYNCNISYFHEQGESETKISGICFFISLVEE